MNTEVITPLTSASIKEMMDLLKPRVMTLVVFSGAVGMWLAPGADHLHPFFQLLVIGCIALGSGAGGMINMWYDRDIDAIMKRTQKRAIPSGKIAADDVLVAGMMVSIVAVTLLGLATNWVAAGWLAFAIFFYAVIYTMLLKRSTSQNIVIGGAAGAFPPVIGWAAVSGDTPLEAWVLFAIIFFWTPPHFWALALFCNEDYQRANIPMLPVTHGKRATLNQILLYTILLAVIATSPLIIGMAGWFYAATSLALNVLFVAFAIHLHLAGENTALAKRLFAYSIFYLFAIFSSLLVDHAIT